MGCGARAASTACAQAAARGRAPAAGWRRLLRRCSPAPAAPERRARWRTAAPGGRSGGRGGGERQRGRGSVSRHVAAPTATMQLRLQLRQQERAVNGCTAQRRRPAWEPHQVVCRKLGFGDGGRQRQAQLRRHLVLGQPPQPAKLRVPQHKGPPAGVDGQATSKPRAERACAPSGCGCSLQCTARTPSQPPWLQQLQPQARLELAARAARSSAAQRPPVVGAQVVHRLAEHLWQGGWPQGVVVVCSRAGTRAARAAAGGCGGRLRWSAPPSPWQVPWANLHGGWLSHTCPHLAPELLAQPLHGLQRLGERRAVARIPLCQLASHTLTHRVQRCLRTGGWNARGGKTMRLRVAASTRARRRPAAGSGTGGRGRRDPRACQEGMACLPEAKAPAVRRDSGARAPASGSPCSSRRTRAPRREPA